MIPLSIQNLEMDVLVERTNLLAQNASSVITAQALVWATFCMNLCTFRRSQRLCLLAVLPFDPSFPVVSHCLYVFPLVSNDVTFIYSTKTYMLHRRQEALLENQRAPSLAQ